MQVGDILEAKWELTGHASKTSIPVYRKAGRSILECSCTVNFSRFNSLLRINSILDYNLTFLQSIKRTRPQFSGSHLAPDPMGTVKALITTLQLSLGYLYPLSLRLEDNFRAGRDL